MVDRFGYGIGNAPVARLSAGKIGLEADTLALHTGLATATWPGNRRYCPAVGLVHKSPACAESTGNSSPIRLRRHLL